MAEWKNPKTDWVTNPKNPVAEDFNRIEGNIAFLRQDIEVKKGAIVDALNTVGLETSMADTHAQIAGKILAANQGKVIFIPGVHVQPIPKGFHNGEGYVDAGTRFASGTTTPDSNGKLEVTGLPFSPELFVFHARATSLGAAIFGIMFSTPRIITAFGNRYGGFWTQSGAVTVDQNPMLSDGFSYTHISLYERWFKGSPYYWYAFETLPTQ